MKKFLSLSLALTLALGMMSFTTTTETASALATATAQGPKWERLGMRNVNLRGDHDEIPVTAKEGFFTKVKFVVRGADIWVKNVRIVFGNGESKNIKVGRKMLQGQESPVIDLPGNRRVIKKIVMNYKKIPNFKGKATVVVWGKH